MTFGFGFWLLLYLHIVAILSYFFQRCDLTNRQAEKTERQTDKKTERQVGPILVFIVGTSDTDVSLNFEVNQVDKLSR